MRTLVGSCLLAALPGLALAQATDAGAHCVKTVRWNDDAPFSVKTQDGELRGFSIDLMREVLARMGCTPRFVEMPWARALVELEAGRLDLLPGALRTRERERFAWFSRPTIRSPNVLFVHKNAAAIYSVGKLGDLIGTNFRLGAQIGVAYGPEYDALSNKPAFQARITPLAQRRHGWKMMEAGRIDGMIADESTALVELQQLGLSGLVVRSKLVVSSDPALVAMSRKSVDARFVAAFDKSLASLVSDGTYREIRERHVPCSTSIETLGCK